MNTLSDPNTTDPFARSIDQARLLAALNRAPAASCSDAILSKRAVDLSATTREVGLRAVAQSDITTPPTPTPLQYSAASPLLAVEGDVGLASQSRELVPGATDIAANWKQQIGAAKLAWNRLTEHELQKSEGHEHKLAFLVQERYFIGAEEARRRVRTFLEKQQT